MKEDYKKVLNARGFKFKECLCIIYDEDSIFYINNEDELKQFIQDQKENLEE